MSKIGCKRKCIDLFSVQGQLDFDIAYEKVEIIDIERQIFYVTILCLILNKFYKEESEKIYFDLFEATVMTCFFYFLVVSDLMSNKFLNRFDL